MLLLLHDLHEDAKKRHQPRQYLIYDLELLVLFFIRNSMGIFLQVLQCFMIYGSIICSNLHKLLDS